MVTVGRCEAFAVIYLGKMIDSLTMSERCFTAGPFSLCRILLSSCGDDISGEEVLAKNALQRGRGLRSR